MLYVDVFFFLSFFLICYFAFSSPSSPFKALLHDMNVSYNRNLTGLGEEKYHNLTRSNSTPSFSIMMFSLTKYVE